MRRLAFLLAGLALLGAGCGDKSSSGATGHLVIAVDVPVTGSPYVAQTIRQGVELATSNLNGGGGVRVGDKSYLLDVKLYDNHLSARTAVEDARRAIGARAVTIVTDGTGVDATWQLAKRAGVSIAITHDGGTGLVDAETRPNVFRIAPTNHGIAFRYAEYLIPKKLKIGLLSDDSAYGREGATDIGRAFSGNPEAVALKLTLPAGQTDLTPQILRARRSGATALLVWGQPPTIASVLSASRSIGWQVPVYTPPTGSDPFIRQQLADHPKWVDGLTFAGGRLTAEVGTGPFVNFQSQYESTYGADQVGVKNSQGQAVVQPPSSRCTPTISSTCCWRQSARGVGRTGQGDRRAEPGHDAGCERRRAWLQRAQPRGRGRRRRLLRPLPRHDLCAGDRRPALGDAAADHADARAMRRALLAALAGMLLAPAAALADVQQVLLPGPTPFPTPSPPLQTVGAPPWATLTFKIDAHSDQRVRAGVDGQGRVVAVRALQRLYLTGTGDYLIVVSAPVLDVRDGSWLAVGTRAAARADPLVGLFFQGRLLAADASLHPGPVRAYLPLRLQARRDGDRYELTVTNTTATSEVVFQGAGTAKELAALLDRTRRDSLAHRRLRPAYVTIRGLVSQRADKPQDRGAAAGGGRAALPDRAFGGSRRDARRAHRSLLVRARRRAAADPPDRGQWRRRAAAAARGPAGQCRPRPDAACSVPASWSAAVARRPLGADALLERLIDTRMELVRSDQFQGFLSNPDAARPRPHGLRLCDGRRGSPRGDRLDRGQDRQQRPDGIARGRRFRFAAGAALVAWAHS